MNKSQFRIVFGLIVLLIIITLPLWVPNPYWVHVATLIAIWWILVSGLNLVIGFTGVLSIGHVGLLATGAYTASILVNRSDMSTFLAVIIAGLVTAVVAAIVSLPSLRLQQFYFAMATVGLATVINRLAYGLVKITGGGTGMPAPIFTGFWGTETGFYLLTLIIALVGSWLCWNIARSNVGLSLIAIRDSPEAAEALGVPVYRLKVAVFTFSGLMAGIAGALYASLQTYITPEAFTFSISILFFVAILIGGQGSLIGPLIGIIVLGLLPEISGPLAKLSQLFYGVLLLFVVLFVPRGISSVFQRIGERRGGSVPETVNIELDKVRENINSLMAAETVAAKSKPVETGLRATNLVKSFGGLKAVDNVTLEVAPGTIHGLIGPNGSGKTTILNLLLGYYRSDSGSVYLDGVDLSHCDVKKRVKAGLSRSFQTPKVLGELTVLDNVRMGLGLHKNQGFVQSSLMVGGVMRNEQEMRRAAFDLVQSFGLDHIAEKRAKILQHDQERFIEIARAIAQGPRYILLDEPAGGLTDGEIEVLGKILNEIKRAGIGVLLVEHHADFVFKLCDTVTVLDFGRMIAQGSPDQVQRDPQVISAYLGQ